MLLATLHCWQFPARLYKFLLPSASEIVQPTAGVSEVLKLELIPVKDDMVVVLPNHTRHH
jgi:hypothetical protein